MLRTGDIIAGKYTAIKELGRGGMSIVYLAIDGKSGTRIAIKEVPKSKIKQGLLSEPALLAKLQHKNISRLLEVLEQDDRYLLIMEYIEGPALEQLLQGEGAQPVERVTDWALQLCEVLMYLHTRKPAVIYRDIKPANIMLRRDGSIALIDYGAALEGTDNRITDMTYLGTRGFAAPEQFRGKGQIDARADIYALGVTLYYLLTAHNPAKPPYEMYPAACWESRIPKALQKLITKCTRHNPAERYQTAAELYKALQAADSEIRRARDK